MVKFDAVDWVITFILLTIVASFVAGLVLIIQTADSDAWVRIDDRCFVHTHIYNHWGSDYTARNVYCLKKD